MTQVNKKIYAALSSLLPIEESIYSGEGREYLIYDYFTEMLYFGDNEPEYIKSHITVTYYADAGMPTLLTRHNIRKALYTAGFENIEEANKSPNDKLKFEFTFEFTELLSDVLTDEETTT